MRRHLQVLALAAAAVLAACGDGAAPMTAEGNVRPPAQTVVIDSLRMRLLSDPAEVAGGTLRLQVVGEPHALRRGDVVVGTQGEGFLRRVADLRREGDVVVLTTTPADLAEALGSGDFRATVDLPFGAAQGAAAGPSYSLSPVETEFVAAGVQLGPSGLRFNNVTVIDATLCAPAGAARQGCGTVQVGITSGGVSYQAQLDLDAKVSLTKLLEQAHVQVDGSLGFDVDAWAEMTIEGVREYERPLATQKQHFVAWAGPIPIKGTVRTELVARIEVASGGAVRATAGFNSGVSTTVGARYVRGRPVEKIVRWDPRVTGTAPRLSAYPQATLTLAIEPRVTVSVLGIPGDSRLGLEAYGEIKVQPNVAKGTASYSLGWGLNAQAGINFRIFDKELAEFTYTQHLYDKTLASGEATLPRVATALAAVSGNGQSGATGGKLPQPLVVRATDAAGRPVQGADVRFGVVSGGGSLSATRATTSSTGEARVDWTLGSTQGAQAASAWLATVPSATVRFNATGVKPTPAPAVSGVSPNPVPGSASERTIGITGANFVSGARLLFRVNGSTYEVGGSKVTVSSASQIQARVTLGTAAATWTVQVVNPDGKASGQYTFRVTAPSAAAPSITSVSPNPVQGSNSERTLTINGASFVAGARLLFRVNGNTYEVSGSKVTVVSASQIQARVTLGTAAAAWTVQVVNPDGRSSGQYTFQVTAPPAPAPSIGSVSPNPVPGSSSERTLTINGAGFASGARLLFRVNGNTYEVSGSKVTVASASQIQARVTLGTTAAVWTVQVVNPDGRSSGQYAFQVTAPPTPWPSISYVTPNPFPAANREQTLTLRGSGFSAGARLIFRVNGNTYHVGGASVTVSGSSEVRARVNLGTTRATWTVEVVNADGKASGQYAFRVS